MAISPGALKRALEALRGQQPANAATGATHAAAWATPDGLIAAVREDVGRHNALDKLIGCLLQTSTDCTRGFCVVTSRASYEMVQKAATIGMPLLVAISAPTAYAIRLAEEAGITLVGFARGERYVVYACPARLNPTSN
jgi:FdhD protein